MTDGIDWEAEVAGIETPVEAAVKRALAECGKWDNVLILYQYAADDDVAQYGFIRDEGQSVERSYWFTRTFDHGQMHEETDE